VARANTSSPLGATAVRTLAGIPSGAINMGALRNKFQPRSLTGSGSVTIPAGVTSVTFTGRGANGGDNSYDDPGQPYIAPTIAQNPHYSTLNLTNPTCTDTAGSYGPTDVVHGTNVTSWKTRIIRQRHPRDGSLPEIVWDYYDNTAIFGSKPADTSDHTSTPSDPLYFGYTDYRLYEAGTWTDFMSWNCPVVTNPGQPYQPPSSGGGPTTGASTLATLNGVTRTWIGGTGSGVLGTVSNQTTVTTGAAQTLNYVVPSGGLLSYVFNY
jgi:hypothetical protein